MRMPNIIQLSSGMKQSALRNQETYVRCSLTPALHSPPSFPLQLPFVVSASHGL